MSADGIDRFVECGSSTNMSDSLGAQGASIETLSA